MGEYRLASGRRTAWGRRGMREGCVPFLGLWLRSLWGFVLILLTMKSAYKVARVRLPALPTSSRSVKDPVVDTLRTFNVILTVEQGIR